MSSLINHFYRFGDLAIDVDQRVLLRGGKPVPLTPKVFDTLLVLVEQHGRLVGKDELMSRLWPDSFVEETNLTFNIKQLRKALGDHAHQPTYIETVARRGYRFIAEVDEVLIETSLLRGHISVRPNDFALNEGSGFATRESGRPDSSASGQPAQQTLSIIEESATAPESVPAIYSIVRRHSFLIGAAMSVVLVLGAGFLTWHFRNGSNPNHNNRKVGVAPALAVPALKVEKLTGTGKNRHAVISPDGRYVAYTSEAKGRQGIWLRQLTTKTSREIVSLSEGGILGLAFARSGEHLYFVKVLPTSWAMYRVPLPLGGVPAKLIEKPQGTFSLSPEDRQVAFVRYSDDDKECALMIANTDGGNERALAVHAQPDRFNTPAWSPDGRTIAVAVGPSDSGSQEVRIVEFNVADGSEKEVTTGKWFHVARILWLPDQSGLIIAGERTIGETKPLWRIDYPSGEVSQLTDGPTSYTDISITANAGQAVAPQMTFASHLWAGPGGEARNLKSITHAVGSFCWTTDGRLIYSSTASANRHLWVMQPDGTEQKQLTDVGEQNTSPAITSDGRYIIFISNRAGASQVWRMDADGSNPTQLTTGKGATSPALSADGQWVIYNDIGDWRLWKTSIDGGESAPLTESYAVDPSVSPDGTLIAYVGKDDRKTRKLLIIPATGGPPVRAFDIAPLRLSSSRLKWTPDESAVLYAASRDGIAGIYRQSLDGGVPEKMIEFDEDDVFDFGYSPGGQQLAVTRGGWQFDVILLSDFGSGSKTGRQLSHERARVKDTISDSFVAAVPKGTTEILLGKGAGSQSRNGCLRHRRTLKRDLNRNEGRGLREER